MEMKEREREEAFQPGNFAVEAFVNQTNLCQQTRTFVFLLLLLPHFFLVRCSFIFLNYFCNYYYCSFVCFVLYDCGFFLFHFFFHSNFILRVNRNKARIAKKCGHKIIVINNYIILIFSFNFQCVYFFILDNFHCP